MQKIETVNDLTDFEKVKDRIFMDCIPADDARITDEHAVSLTVGDIAIVYRILIGENSSMVQTALISEGLLEGYGISKDELHLIALDSAPKLFPCFYTPIASVTDATVDERVSDDIFVLTTKSMVYGASAMFYPGVLESIAEKMGGNLYVIPSSRNECIICVDRGGLNPETLRSSLIQINGNTDLVPEDLYLSDSLYYYSKDKSILSMLPEEATVGCLS